MKKGRSKSLTVDGYSGFKRLAGDRADEHRHGSVRVNHALAL
jgi:hypothetical protein